MYTLIYVFLEECLLQHTLLCISTHCMHDYNFAMDAYTFAMDVYTFAMDVYTFAMDVYT